MSETSKPKRKPSPATLATRAFGRVQQLKQKQERHHAAKDAWLTKWEAKRIELQEALAQAEAELEKHRRE